MEQNFLVYVEKKCKTISVAVVKNQRVYVIGRRYILEYILQFYLRNRDIIGS